MMSSTLDDLYEKAKRAMHISRQMMLKRSGVDKHSSKGEKDFATDVDFAIEAEVRSFLESSTPDIPLLGEENGGADINDSLFWALDPIDGTINYARDIPLCGISLALIKNGKAVIGLIDLPYLSQSYEAVEGKGAFLNGQKISISEVEKLEKSIVSFGDFAVGVGEKQKNKKRLGVINALSGHVMRVRMLGSAAIDLAWLANGVMDASITLSNNAWDVQAGILIVREAGGVVCDLDGSPHNVLSKCTIATTPTLKNELLTLLAEFIQ